MPRVSIGLPFYNNVNTLGMAIRSVFSQTYHDWELILVNDGSTDGSHELANMVNHPRVRLVSDGRNCGLAYRLNQISDLALGEYIARMDADDLMHPQRLQYQVEYMDAHPEVQIVGTAAYVIDSSNVIVGIRSLGPLEDNNIAVLNNNMLIHPTVMGRKRWFLNNRYDPTFLRAQDYELWCKTYKPSAFAKIQLPLYFYRDYGRFDIDNYFRSCSSRCKVLLRYGPSAVGRVSTGLLVFQVCAKAAIYWLANCLGIEGILLRTRNRRASPEEVADASRVLGQIMGTQVPGLYHG